MNLMPFVNKKQGGLLLLLPSLHWYLQQVGRWWNGQGSHCFLQAAVSTPCTEVTPALQHNNGVASHNTEFRLAEISSPVSARLSYQEVTACVQQPRPGLDGQQGPSWTLTLHAISNSPKSHMTLLFTQAYKVWDSAHVCLYIIVLYCFNTNYRITLWIFI